MRSASTAEKTVPLCVFSPEASVRAAALAKSLGVPLVQTPEDCAAAELCLEERAEGLTLSDGRLALTVDFAASAARLQRNNLGGELLVRAAKGRDCAPHPTLLDATAGLGEDAFLLAAAGFSVTMYESDPMIAALLADGLCRAAGDEDLCEIVGRMRLVVGDSTVAMRQMETPPDVVYLDPMFPKRQKSGAVKKKFQLLQKRQPPCADEEELLSAALALGARKIVVKRPRNAPPLCGQTPSYTLCGTSIRYDCIVRTGGNLCH